MVWEGDPQTDLSLVLKGCLRLCRQLSDGRRAVIRFGFPGDLLGLADRDVSVYTVETITPVQLRRVNRSALISQADRPELLQALLLSRATEDIRCTQEHAVALGRLGSDERLAYFLTSVLPRTARGGEVTVELPMTRPDIADYLGLSVETVCRVLRKFHRNKLIRVEGRHKVVLRLHSALEALSGSGNKQASSRRAVAY